MDRYVLRLRDLCLVSLLMGVGGALALWAYFSQSQWSYLFSDVADEVAPIEEVRFIAEWPLSTETLKQALAGEDLESRSFSIRVANQGARSSGELLFRDQARAGLEASGKRLDGDLEGIRYAFYVDIGPQVLEPLKHPFVFFYTVWSPYQFFVNGKLVKDLDGRAEYVGASQLLGMTNSATRLLWVVNNDTSNRIPGLNFQNGLSLRSAKSASRSLMRLPIQMQFPRVASSLSFLIVGVIALALAVAARRYLDLWAFSTFCLMLALYIWLQTPMVYDGFQGRGATLASIMGIVACASIIASAVLSMAYFRLDGRHIRLPARLSLFAVTRHLTLPTVGSLLVHPFRATLFSTVLLSAIALISFWPMSTTLDIPYAIAAINTRLTYILCASQLLAFFFGFKALFELRAKHKRDGLEAQVSMLNRRIALSIVFAVSMLLMLAVYIAGFGTVSLEVGTDFILVAAIFPALAMLLMFFSMVSSGTRFYARFAPRLGQIDHEVMAFGAKALERRYYGALLVFDVAGMKKLNNLRSHSAAVEQAVDGFVSRIEHDLADLVQRGRVTFRYKSNGDEFIFAMRAKDLQSASALTTELMTIWVRESAKYMNAWRDELVERLQTLLPGGAVEARAVAASIELHVLATTLKDMKITIKGGIERPEASPDFLDARFTSLSALFKPTRHNVVAMYRDDAEALIAALPQAKFAPFDSQSEMGFVSWLSTADISHPTAA